MRIFIIAAVCLYAALRLFCSLLLKDKTFLFGDSRHVFATSVGIAVASAGATAAAGYICENFLGGLTDATLLTLISALLGAALGVGITAAVKKLYNVGGIYFPALVLSSIVSSVMTAVTFGGEEYVSLILHSIPSVLAFAALPVFWHSIRLCAEKVKFPPLFEAVGILSLLCAVLSVV